ncbi:myosin-11-like [Zophobas morio]|uniref:myosin-11-like n=1 Tax=Zophobas morio TaxID=2755281 RepID=UPI003083B415
MDNFETLSNCSETSRSSESVSSNISTLSTLSDYQDEFVELKQVLNEENVLTDTTKTGLVATNIIRCYDKQIVNLNAQLQNALKQNETYKNEIYSLEKKKDLLDGAKIGKLLKQNKQLEDSLSAANNQIKRLIDICHKRDDFDENMVILEEKNLHLEKANHELTNQIYLLSNKINHCSFQKNEIENECRNFKSEMNDLKLELAVKTECVNELKRKLSQQHVQLEEVLQNNIKLSHSLELISNDLQYAKKSENWYKMELQRIQEEKSSLSDKIFKNERIIALQEEDIEQLNLELNSMKCAFDGIRLTALKEKEEMCKGVESVNRDKHLTKDNESLNISDSIISSIGGISSHYETVISDLTNDVQKIKSDFEQQRQYFENVSKEKVEVLSKYLTLQSSLAEKENTIEKLESNIKALKNQLLLENSRREQQNVELLDLKKAFTKLEVELNLNNKDKEMFEHTVTTIREQFKVLSAKYLQLKSEQQCANKEILQLQYEKQELCVDNNQKTAEIKRNREKDALEIKKLKQKVVFLEGVEAEVKFENKKLLETINKLNEELMQLKTQVSKFHTQYADITSKYEDSNSVQTHLQEVEDSGQFYPSLETSREDSHSFRLTNLTDTLKYICQLCKMHENEYRRNFSELSEDEYVKLLLHKIESYHRFVDTQISANGRKKLCVSKRNILSKILRLVERCKMLEKKTEDNSEMLKLNAIDGKHDKNSIFNEEIRRLHVKLEVKTQEEKEKRKKYERNYRTLLRKVKEHMKGRKFAEKRNDYLQELHSTLSSERNTLCLQLDLKRSELKELQDRVERYSSANEKLKSVVSKLENQFANFTSRCKCDELEKIESSYIQLERSLKECENHKNASIAELKLKEERFDILHKENKRLLTENSSLCARVLDLESELTKIKSCEAQLRNELVFVQNSISTTRADNAELNSQLDEITKNHIQLQQEVEQLKSCLQRKSEEISEFKLRKEQTMRKWTETETNMQNLVTTLKNEVYNFKGEIHLLKNEKLFLQRLCNDLNVALKTHVSQNKLLKKCVERACEEREQIGNDTDILSSFPSPIKCDDSYIEKLLQESTTPIQDKPYCDIQECLNTLRKEILCLQKQIVEKM